MAEHRFILKWPDREEEEVVMDAPFTPAVDVFRFEHDGTSWRVVGTRENAYICEPR